MPPESPALTLPPAEQGRAALSSVVVGQVLRGRFRVGRIFENICSNGTGYRVVELLDRTGKLRCLAWPNIVTVPMAIPEWTIVDVEFQIQERDRARFGKLKAIDTVAEPSALDQVGTLPLGISPVAGVIDRLRCVVAQISTPALHGFVTRVFANATLARAYFRVQASFGDHHGQEGGVAEHSIEMATNAALLIGLAPLDRDLAIVQSLFHDIGKIRTHEKSPLGFKTHALIGHEALTLEILAPALQWLDGVWPDGALALRHGWTVGLNSYRSHLKPMHPAVAVVRGLDGISRDAALHREFHPNPGGFVELSRDRKLWSPNLP